MSMLMVGFAPVMLAKLERALGNTRWDCFARGTVLEKESMLSLGRLQSITLYAVHEWDLRIKESDYYAGLQLRRP